MSKEFVDAAFAGNEATVRRLLAGGADPSAVDDGYTALGCAAQEGHVNVVRVLVEAGAMKSAMMVR